MTKQLIQQQIKEFENANEVVNDVRSMLTKTLFEGTQENAFKLSRAYSLLQNLHAVNTRQVKELKEQLRSMKYEKDSPIEAPIPAAEQASVTQ